MQNATKVLRLFKGQWTQFSSLAAVKKITERLTDKAVNEKKLLKALNSVIDSLFVEDKDTHSLSELKEIFEASAVAWDNDKYEKKIKEKQMNDLDRCRFKLIECANKIQLNLSRTDKEWEFQENRDNWEAVMTYSSDLSDFTNSILLINHRTQVPYVLNNFDNDEFEEFGSRPKPIVSIDGKIIADLEEDARRRMGKREKFWCGDFYQLDVEETFIKFVDTMVKSTHSLLLSLYFFDALVNTYCKDKQKKEERQKEFTKEIPQVRTTRTRTRVLIEDSDEESYESDEEYGKEWNETCFVCDDFGELICCDHCSNVAHLDCAGLKLIPEKWTCNQCLVKLSNQRLTRAQRSKFNA